MLFADRTLLRIIEGHIERVDAHRLLLALQTLVLENIHGDYIDFSKGATSLETHEIVEGLRQDYLHFVGLGQLFKSRGYLQMRRQIASINLVI